MRFWYYWSVAGLASLAIAQCDTIDPSRTAPGCRNTLSVAVASPSATDCSSTSSSSTVSTTTTSAPTSTTAVVVATDSTGHFTAIGDAISYAQSKGISTVTVKAGTYTQAVTVSATPSVIVIGETNKEDDYAQNQVVISTASPLTISVNVIGITFKNINFVNTATGGAAATIRGSQNAFYECQLISAGSVGIDASLGLGIIANSYIEAVDKLIYGYPSLYIFNTKIVPTGSSALLVYNKGYTSGSTLYNSTVVFDSCSVLQKQGASNKNVYLAAANNGPGSIAVYRNSRLDGLIAGTGAHVDSATQGTLNFYGEYGTTGTGSYGSNQASRSQYVSLMSQSDLDRFSVARVFAGVYPQFASSTTSWVDADVLAEIVKAAQVQTSSTAVIHSSTPTASTVTSSTVPTATPTSTLVVSQDPSPGQYANVSQAIAALPKDGKPYTIYIKAGTYIEQLSITRAGKVTLRGETSFENDYTQNRVTIQFSFGVLTSEGRNEETPVIYAKKNDGSGLALYNINFVNTYPQTRNTAALAADFYGSNLAAYGCSFIGYQDTLLANKGTQVFSNCYIEGSVDYIWGFSTAYFHQCYLATNTPGTSIAAQSRSSSTAAGGYVFDSCYLTYTNSYGTTFGRTYLGRPYSEFSIAVYLNSYLDKHINAAGWDIWSTSSPNTGHVTFGEYGNSGPGAWSSGRATFATSLTAEQAAQYSLSSWIGDTSWLDMEAYNSVPSYPLTGPSATNSTSPATSTPTATATATWGHPTSGTTPPVGALLVSQDESITGSYRNLTAALAALPNDASTQIIFMYPGSYNEQVPSVNRQGPVQIIGYQPGNPGQTYQTNQVTLTFARGLSVSPLPSGHSNSETATLATTSNKIALYNINMVNTENLDGSQPSYVTLAASIYGSQIGFYGCSFVGWQDTLLTGSTAGYQYYESCYIEGAIDFIWGYSKAYFKGCTLGAKKAKSAIVAQSRASSAAIGGYIFDQCLFDAAPSATVDLTKSVYIGRPYSAYSLVVVKNSYLSNVIQPAGWKVWSTTDPRTDYITFAEYQNSGPGNWENNVAARQSFGKATLLESDTYTLDAVMGSTDWIDLTHWDSITVPAGTPSTTPTTTPGATPTPTPTAYDGTTPPAGAYIVSKTPIDNLTTYETIQSALNALPASSKVTPTVFIYPGVYHEQLVLNRSGTTVFLGYSTSPFDYASNTVTIQYNAGVDTQADQSNTDSATVYATGNGFQARNINFVNDFGGKKNYASLGFAVRSSKYAALYGCQVKGNQDALLINGYFFASNSYIEGNIDMIWGAGAGYFLKSTIASNRDGISLTAHKRASNTTAAGFVFDQCTVVPAMGAGSMSSLSLGRPWNALARVAFVGSYLDSSITAAGWDTWLSSSPNTDGVVFGEYQNSGPGAWNANRASFATQLDDAAVAQFQLASFFGSTSWIDMTRVSGTPFVPGGVVVSSTAVPLTTPAPSTSAVSAMVTTLVTVTDKETAYTTVTSADKTTTAVFTVTEDVGSTITAAQSTKTTTQKTTITTTVVITEPTVTSTRKVVVTSDVGRTITPAPSTETTTVKETSTVMATITEAPATVTVKSTTTSSAITTVTPKALTTTSTAVSTTTSVKTSTPRTVKTTSSVTITKGTAGTATTTAKATTTTQTVTSTVSTTKSVTTTLRCIPTEAKRAVFRRANTATVTEYTTFTTFVKTSTVKLPASTAIISATTTKTTGKTTTLRAPTTTLTVVSTAIKASTSTIPAITSFVTETSTSTVGKTTTLKASTTTVTATSLATRTSTATVHGATQTITSIKTTTVGSTVSLPRSTLTVIKSDVLTVKSTVTLATPTTTVVKTTTETLKPSVTVTSRATSTKTRTVKTTVTETHTVTKTLKGAVACPTD
ncbi:putative pectin methylesterase [Aspergillus clavatus NRRL 1]|uniref:Probable pectinesterase A n=1 Tax=Aspergillus clavatus (strain ATCC 1007 / CBS 513.65 / DSM 816 / NCTC 3887 / NRRL 1 / QM 1276 / 107) TaxID=344612 RepID=A1C8R7_ASPCL|nr:pectinesterase family protein [Aspergillus clavatus NRRL 1]EAW13704.1 pectinesterase family protein [Aspergillus clavatus NRRL 1]